MYTWDILFLLPVPWVGPVLAPCLSSLTMLLLMCLLFYFHGKNISVRFSRMEWILLSAGALIVIGSFVQDYLLWIQQREPVAGNDLFADFKTYVPTSYNWSLFLAGEALVLLAMARLWHRLKRTPAIG